LPPQRSVGGPANRPASGVVRSTSGLTKKQREDAARAKLKASLGASRGSAPIGGFLRRAASPLKELVDVVATPGYAVGDLIQGKPGRAGRRFVNIGPEITDVARAFNPAAAVAAVVGRDNPIPRVPRFGLPDPVTPGQALAQRGLLPKRGGFGGAAARFAADVALDPTTYVTFGAGGVAKAAAARAGSAALERGAREAVERGGSIRLATVARSAMESATARKGTPGRLTVGVKIPGRRGQQVVLGRRGEQSGSERAYRALRAPVTKAGDTRLGKLTRELLVPAGASDKAVHETGRLTIAAASSEKDALSKRLAALNGSSSLSGERG